VRRNASDVRRIGLRAVLVFCAVAIPACRSEEQERSGPKGGGAIYRCDGFAGPIQPQMEIQRGRTLPLKANLLDAAGTPARDQQIDPPPEIRLLKLEEGGEVDRTEQAAAGDFGQAGRFVFRESYWKFDLATADFPELGTYRAEIASGEESRYRIEPRCAVTFVLR
jgi:hypothetical protein